MKLSNIIKNDFQNKPYENINDEINHLKNVKESLSKEFNYYAARRSAERQRFLNQHLATGESEDTWNMSSNYSEYCNSVPYVKCNDILKTAQRLNNKIDKLKQMKKARIDSSRYPYTL